MRMRTCAKCGKTQAESNFVRRGQSYRNLCKECKRSYNRQHYTDNKSYYVDKKMRFGAVFDEWYQELKRGCPCADCGNSYHPVAMDWDHRPGEFKLGAVANLRNLHNRQRVLNEIAKCDLVCAVCHRIRTAKRCGVI